MLKHLFIAYLFVLNTFVKYRQIQNKQEQKQQEDLRKVQRLQTIKKMQSSDSGHNWVVRGESLPMILIRHQLNGL